MFSIANNSPDVKSIWQIGDISSPCSVEFLGQRSLANIFAVFTWNHGVRTGSNASLWTIVLVLSIVAHALKGVTL